MALWVVYIFYFQAIKRFCLDLTNLSKLRWLLFSKYQYKATQLPPIMGALNYKIFRSHYAYMILKKSHVSKQKLPSLERYSWELNGTSLDPIMIDNLPAPLALTELCICNCKGNCSTRKCQCFKNSLLCTDMFKCSRCNKSNTFKDDNLEIFEHNESEVEDYKWHYLFGIFILKALSKMSGACVM